MQAERPRWDAGLMKDHHLLRLLGVPRERGDSPPLALLPLRLFLGVTFLYAGLQKLTDSQFFSPLAPGFIGRQMSGFVHSGSPLSVLLTHGAIAHAAPLGALIAFCELWVGLSALLGLLTRVGALGGLGLSLTLYLTATWSVHPYFLGADLPYALCWLTLLLAGPGLYSLDASFGRRLLAARAAVRVPGGTRGRATPAPVPLATDPLARAVLLRWVGTAAAVVGGGGIVGGMAKLLTPSRPATTSATPLGGASPSASGGGGAPGAGAASPTTASAPAAPAGYTYLGSARQMPVNSAGQYTDPISGDPAVLVHLPTGQFVAYDAVCTHAGCTVEYDPTQRQLICPCHGAVYDPAQSAQVLAGPTSQPLAPLQVRIDAHGNAYGKA